MAAGSEGRDEAPGAAGLRFQFRGVAAGLRGQEAAPELVALPVEPLIQDVTPAPDARSRARWIPGVLLAAFLAGIGGWLMLLSSSALSGADPKLSERDDGVPVGGPSEPPKAVTPSSPPPVVAVLAEASTSPPPSAPLAPPSASPPTAITPDVRSARKLERHKKHRPPSAPPASSKVRPVISIESAASSGGLTSVDIRRVLDPLRADLRRCLASELERGLDIRQLVVVKMAVRGSAVESPISQPTMRSPRLWLCIRNVLISAEFKEHQGYTGVTLSLQLGPP